VYARAARGREATAVRTMQKYIDTSLLEYDGGGKGNENENENDREEKKKEPLKPTSVQRLSWLG